MVKQIVLILTLETDDYALAYQALQKEYKVCRVENQSQVIEYLKNYEHQIALILFAPSKEDLWQHNMLTELEQSGAKEDIPVIMLENAALCDLGEDTVQYCVDDILERPLRPEIIKRRVNQVIELYRCRKQLKQVNMRRIEEQENEYIRHRAHYAKIERILLESLHLRNVESVQHVRYVEAYTRILAEHYAQLYPRSRMTPDKIDMIARAARLHDVGKIMFPDSIAARPGRMSDTEMEILKNHVDTGSQIVNALTEYESEKFRKICHNVCSYHHEKYDGSGYPGVLQKDKIPIEAQIVAVADMYDTIVNTWNEYQGNPKEYAYYMLINGECGELSVRMKESLSDAKEDMETFSIDSLKEENRGL